MTSFINKWLPIIFGCHCRSDRSIYIKGKKLPICARCTGELIGIIVSIILFRFIKTSLLFDLIIMMPLVLDGFIQLKTSYESNNTKRMITGILFGYGLSNLFIKSVVFTFISGQNFSKRYLK